MFLTTIMSLLPSTRRLNRHSHLTNNPDRERRSLVSTAEIFCILYFSRMHAPHTVVKMIIKNNHLPFLTQSWINSEFHRPHKRTSGGRRKTPAKFMSDAEIFISQQSLPVIKQELIATLRPLGLFPGINTHMCLDATVASVWFSKGQADESSSSQYPF